MFPICVANAEARQWGTGRTWCRRVLLSVTRNQTTSL
jgi:hypothetical protein